MKRVEYAGGVIRALLAAGPVFLITILIGAVILKSPDTIQVWELLYLIPLLMASVAFGLMISLVPILTGTAVMATAGIYWSWTRGRSIWAAAGASLGMMMVLPFGNSGGAVDWGSLALFAITGAICALIVRYGTRWSDESV
jgi:hypothetical protein